VLVDFKGGATFLGLGALPHVSAVITNLADELHLVDRMADAAAGEITPTTGAAAGRGQPDRYGRVRRRAPDGRPRTCLRCRRCSWSSTSSPSCSPSDPSWSTCLGTDRAARSIARHPPAARLAAARRGPAARARLAPVLPDRAAHLLRCRVARGLGVPDAHQLPPAPGSAFLSTGPASWCGSGPRTSPAPSPGPAGPPSWAAHRAGPPLPVGPVGADRTPRRRRDGVAGAAHGARHDDRRDGRDGPPRTACGLPPLAARPPLDELLGRPGPAGPGLRSAWPDGTAARARRRVDRPYLQRRDRWRSTSRGATGHLAVVGGPRRASPARCGRCCWPSRSTHGPDELGMHVLDFGGGGLAVLAGLPTSAPVRTPASGRRAPDRRRGGAVLDRRERLFRSAGVGSIEEFRARRRRGVPDEAATDVLLVVDGYLVLRGEFDDLEARLLPLAAQGLSYGLHLVVTASRCSELRPALKDVLAAASSCGWGEPAESEVDRRRAAAVPARPGHGLRRTGHDGAGGPWLSATDSTRLAAATLRRSRGRPGGRRVDRPVFAPVAMLPERVHLDDIPAVSRGRCRKRRGRHSIGLDEEGLAPVASIWARTRTWCASRTRRAARPPCCAWSCTGWLRGTHRTSCASWSSTTAGAARRRPRRAPARLREFGRRGRGGGPTTSRRPCGDGCRARPSGSVSCGNAAGGAARKWSCSSTTTTSSPPVARPPTRCCRSWSSCRRPRTSACMW
jgi:S-DNA-T family DNA segregation ATPase FtsK/SpoIIIE